jgi:polygalacturonase
MSWQLTNPPESENRRECFFVKSGKVLVLLLATVLIFSAFAWAQSTTSNATLNNAWETVLPSILNKIQPPAFPNKDFYVTNFGAVGNGTTDCSEAFAKAIQACNEAGGGRVVVPAGKFLTGPINLLSNVDLYLEKGAVILFSTNANLYSKHEPAGKKHMPLISAYDQANVAVTGEGTLDGQANAQNWWPWKKIKKLSDLRPIFIRVRECQNVLIQGVSIVNSPAWQIKLELSDNVTINGIDIDSLGPNNDGIDVSSDRYVLIENSTFNTGDDCIALASGGGSPNPPVTDIVIRNDKMLHGHGSVTIGSAVSNGASDVFVENCTIGSPNAAPWDLLRIKSNIKIGGTIQNIYVKNVKVVKVSKAIFSVNFDYSLKLSHMLGKSGIRIPVVRNVYLDNINSQESRYVLLIKGYEKSPVTNVNVFDSTFNNVQDGNTLDYVDELHIVNSLLNGSTFD